VHQAHHRRRAEAGAKAVERPGSDAVVKKLAVSFTRCTAESSDSVPVMAMGSPEYLFKNVAMNAPADHERHEQRHGHALGPRSLRAQLRVDPVGPLLHRSDEALQLGRRVGHGLDAVLAGRHQHVDQPLEAVLRDERRVRVRHHVAQHGVREHALHRVVSARTGPAVLRRETRRGSMLCTLGSRVKRSGTVSKSTPPYRDGISVFWERTWALRLARGMVIEGTPAAGSDGLDPTDASRTRVPEPAGSGTIPYAIAVKASGRDGGSWRIR
jgi:hypothetical protein